MRDVLILCYHAVSPSWPSSLAVTPDELEHQLEDLLHQGYSAATFSEAINDPPSARTLAVTFDDAFASVITHGVPILRRLGVRATIFVPTTPVELGRALAWPGVAEWIHGPCANELMPLSWDDLAELADLGWEVGSHTASHPRLTRLPSDRLAEELEESRRTLELRLGSCSSIAYPYGDVDDRVAAAAADAGYTGGAALGRWPGDSAPMRSPRVGIYRRDTGKRFTLKTSRPLRRLAASRPMAGARGH